MHSMKKLLVVPLALIAMASPAYVVSQHPKVVLKEVPVTVTKTVTNTVQAPVPSYRVGDTQNGITLVGVYHSSYQNQMAGNGATPPQVNVIAFAVSGVSQNDAEEFSAILTPSGIDASKPALTRVDQCGSNACAVFYDTGTPSVFYYKDLKWEL